MEKYKHFSLSKPVSVPLPKIFFRMRVVQYIAYYPPHIGGLESHAAQRAQRWMQEWCGECLIATYSIGQPTTLTYQHDQVTVVVIPAFEIIPTFPFPKFWTSEYRQAHRLIKEFAPDILITRTRFFLASLFGALFAKWHRIKRVHIEHGVDYVKLNTWWKNALAWLYDQTIGRCIFHRADQIIGISEGCKRFVSHFTDREVEVIYRGLDSAIQPNPIAPGVEQFALCSVGRLTALKGIDVLLYALKLVIEQGRTNIHLTLIGDGEEKQKLELLSQQLWLEAWVTFAGYQTKTALEQTYYPRMHIILNTSYQEWLPTSVVEWLLAQCIVVATQVGGTPEISDQPDLILVAPGDRYALAECIQKAIDGYAVHAWKSREHVLQKFSRATNIRRYQKSLS